MKIEVAIIEIQVKIAFKFYDKIQFL